MNAETACAPFKFKAVSGRGKASSVDFFLAWNQWAEDVHNELPDPGTSHVVSTDGRSKYTALKRL